MGNSGVRLWVLLILPLRINASTDGELIMFQNQFVYRSSLVCVLCHLKVEIPVRKVRVSKEIRVRVPRLFELMFPLLSVRIFAHPTIMDCQNFAGRELCNALVQLPDFTN